MKRSLFWILITTMLFSLISCGNRSGEPSETVSNVTSEISNGIAITDQTEETDKTDKTEMQGGDEIMESGEFNFETKTVALNSGYEMPLMGLGTYSLDYNTCAASVTTFLDNGGRLIDTAYMYIYVKKPLCKA